MGQQSIHTVMRADAKAYGATTVEMAVAFGQNGAMVLSVATVSAGGWLHSCSLLSGKPGNLSLCSCMALDGVG